VERGRFGLARASEGCSHGTSPEAQSACQQPVSQRALGRIRTCAHGSGARDSFYLYAMLSGVGLTRVARMFPWSSRTLRGGVGHEAGSPTSASGRCRTDGRALASSGHGSSVDRLAAIHSLFSYAALRHPEHAAVSQRVLTIPTKRTDRKLVSFLTREEINALLAAPDRDNWAGRRDHALLLVAVQTGLRVAELTSLSCGDVERALARTAPAGTTPGRYRAPDALLAFLDSL
jgi:hypothetical protein